MSDTPLYFDRAHAIGTVEYADGTLIAEFDVLLFDARVGERLTIPCIRNAQFIISSVEWVFADGVLRKIVRVA